MRRSIKGNVFKRNLKGYGYVIVYKSTLTYTDRKSSTNLLVLLISLYTGLIGSEEGARDSFMTLSSSNTNHIFGT